MKVLAIDPGYDRLGVAVLTYENGNEALLFSDCLQSDKTLSVSKRIYALGVEFQKILDAHHPDAIGIETLFFNTNQKTAIAVAASRGMIFYLAEAAGCTVYEYSPQQIKVAVTGHGGSDKRQVAAMVMQLIPNAPTDALDDEYDAIATGITCLAHTRNLPSA